jgi:hypothetical protein
MAILYQNRMSELASRSVYLAVALVSPRDGAALVIPVDDVSEAALGQVAICDAHAKGFRFVQFLGLLKDGAIETANFPGNFPEEILAAIHARFMSLCLESGIVRREGSTN